MKLVIAFAISQYYNYFQKPQKENFCPVVHFPIVWFYESKYNEKLNSFHIWM